MGDSDLAIVSSIVIFLSCLSFFSLKLPDAYQFITVASLSWFTGGTIAIAGACVVATGLPCAAAIAIYAVTTAVLSYFNVLADSAAWITTLILTPLSIILIIFIAKLARGQ